MCLVTSSSLWVTPGFALSPLSSLFLLTCGLAVVPIIQGYEDAGDYTVTERLKTSVHANLVFHLCVGSIALCGLILLIILRSNWDGGILGFAMACSNTFGLVTGAFLLGFGLSEIPKGLWRSADWITRQKVLSHKVAKMAVKLDDAHQEFSNAIVVAQATSKQMSRRDPLRPYLNIIDKMLLKMLSEDPTFKPQGGKLGENDMDYDTNEKTMAQLRRQLKRARERYYRYKRKYISSFRTERAGTLGSFFDMIELVWRCILSTRCLCRQVARYAAPISYNFLNLIRLPRDAKDSKTIFEKRMGNIDDAVPFFGKGFNKIYPLIMVIYTIMITSNFFGRVISYFGNWNIFRHQNEEAEDLDGFDPSGLIILNKGRIIPKFKNGLGLNKDTKLVNLLFHWLGILTTHTDLESASNSTVSGEAKANTSLIEDGKNSYSKFHTADSQHHIGKENTGRKYTAIRTQPTPEETSLNSSQNTTFTEASRDAGDTQDTTILPQSGVSATWQSMKMGFQNFKANIGAVKFLPLRESQENTKHSHVPSSESLDEILEKLKRPAPDHSKYSSDDDLDLDDYVTDIKKSDSSR